ncbi:8149_t:CDS:2, partial [Paraglomus brasilianum]
AMGSQKEEQGSEQQPRTVTFLAPHSDKKLSLEVTNLGSGPQEHPEAQNTKGKECEQMAIHRTVDSTKEEGNEEARTAQEPEIAQKQTFLPPPHLEDRSYSEDEQEFIPSLCQAANCPYDTDFKIVHQKHGGGHKIIFVCVRHTDMAFDGYRKTTVKAVSPSRQSMAYTAPATQTGNFISESLVERIVSEQTEIFEKEVVAGQSKQTSSKEPTGSAKKLKTNRERANPYSTKKAATDRSQSGKPSTTPKKLELATGTVANPVVVEEAASPDSNATIPIIEQYTVPNVESPPFPSKPSAENCIEVTLEGKPTLLAASWKPRHLLTLQSKATNTNREYWVLMNGETTKPLPFSWSFGRLQEENIIKSGDILWFKQRVSKTNYSSSEEETLNTQLNNE